MQNIKLIDALELAKKKPYYFVKGETPEKVLSKVERVLGFSLSNQHKTFYGKVGYLSFAGFEFYGICNDKLTGKDAICAIETTIMERKKNKLPNKWVMFCSFDDGCMGYLDYTNLNEHGEPPLIMALYDGKKHNVLKKVSEDICTYIYNCLQ